MATKAKFPKTKTPVKAPTAAKTEKAKRVSINPQPILDAKTAALKGTGRQTHLGGSQMACR
jgi:hypothetical protein